MFQQVITPQEAKQSSPVALPEVKLLELSKCQQRKFNLQRLKSGFIPADHSFDSFMAMCKEFEPKWFKINSKVSGEIHIQYAPTKYKAYFATAKTFSEAYQKLMIDIYKDIN